jgi:hypothetical protein
VFEGDGNAMILLSGSQEKLLSLYLMFTEDARVDVIVSKTSFSCVTDQTRHAGREYSHSLHEATAPRLEQSAALEQTLMRPHA